MLVNFKHKITQSEVNSKYLNLKDEDGRRYGNQFPSHGTRLVIIDQDERRFSATKHHEHQIWGNLRKWFETNQIAPGTIISVKYDSDERTIEGEPIVYLKVIESEKEESFTKTLIESKRQFKQRPTIKHDRLLTSLKNQIRDIRAYINGNLNVEVSDEKLCFWVWLCYELGLYREGAKIFRRIDERAVSPDFYRIVNKLGIACELKAGSL